MTKALEFTSAKEPEEVAARLLNGWNPRVYRLRPGPLRITRRFLQLGPGVSTQLTRLLTGGVRIDGQIGDGMLKIGFVRSKEIRILGSCEKNPFMAVACGGSRLNFSASLPGTALSLHFDREAAAGIVPAEALPLLTPAASGGGGPETLLHPVTDTGARLEKLLRRLLARAERDGSAATPGEAAQVVETSAGLIAEILVERSTDVGEAAARARRRRSLALAVEALLWEAPQTIGRFSLDDAARRLKCSRRSIQLALQEEFGLGFVVLKRMIRLQQVHALLRVKPLGAAGVGRIARAHEFNHLGRFAGHYRDMFGVLPSLERAEEAVLL